MLRNTLAVFLAVLLVPPAHGYQQKSVTVQEQVGKIAKGAIVEVKTKLKDTKKVKGRLGDVTPEDFEVQVTQDQKVDNVKLRFADVTSVQEKRGMNVAVKTLMVTGIVIGVIGLLAGIACATGCSQ